nr:retrotransposon Orf1 [Tanacetum cinerariifolium]
MINKACYVCSSFEHLQYDYDQRVVKPMWNNTRRVNHKNFASKFNHPHLKRRFVPQAVLTSSGKINTVGAIVTTAVRPVNTASSKSTMNHPRVVSNAFKRGHSQVLMPFNKYSTYKKTIFNKEVNAVKASGCVAIGLLSSQTDTTGYDNDFKHESRKSKEVEAVDFDVVDG